MKYENNELYKFYKRITRSLEKTGTNSVGIRLTKNQLTSPFLKECFMKGYFSEILKKRQITFICEDEELFFNEEETKKLLANYKAMKRARCELYFEESINRKVDASLKRSNIYGVFGDFQIVTKKVSRNFSEIMEINKQLSSIAKRINKIKLSPLEKYFLCYNIVENIEYYLGLPESVESLGYDPSQSFVETVKQNKGCCLGKSQYLKALLNLVGINATTLNVNCNRTMRENCRYIKRIHNGDTFKMLSAVDAMEDSLTKQIKSQDAYFQKLDLDHAVNIIYLNDEKYNVNGIFVGDVTQSLPFIPLNGKIEDVFSVGTFLSSRVTELAYFLKKIEYKDELSEENEEKIEQNFLAWTTPIIINDLRDKLSNLPNVFYADGIQLFKEIWNCKSFFELKTLLDDRRMKTNVFTGEPNKYSEIYEEIFKKWFDNSNDQLCNVLEGLDNRLELEKVPKARDLSKDEYYSLQDIMKETYDKKLSKNKNLQPKSLT